MAENNFWEQQGVQQTGQTTVPQPPVGSQQPSGAQPPYGQPPYGTQPPVAYYAAEPPRKSRGWIVALVCILAFFILIGVGMVSCSNMMASSMNTSFIGSSGTSAATVTTDAVAIIPIDGTIQYDGTFSSPEGLKAQLDAAEKNDHVKAIVLRVNSGGGVATAGEEMSKYVKDFSKPVVVSSASINASAAYEISSQADYIFTAKTTSIGSIGVAMQITDLSGLYEKLGINMQDITSSDSKDSSYGTRPLSEEERAYYQDMVDQINKTFIDTVAEGRHMDASKVKELATGLSFTGMTAVENGLADKIGTLDDAVKKAAELAHMSSYSTVTLRSASSGLDFLDFLGSASSYNDMLSRLKELEADGGIVK